MSTFLDPTLIPTQPSPALADAPLGWQRVLAPPADKARPRLFLVEDDPVFAYLLCQAAETAGAHLDVFDPDDDFDRLPDDGDYDGAIVDFHLGYLNGTQIASLYHETPIVLTSASDTASIEHALWPSSVRSFIGKRRGARTLVETALRLAGSPSRL